MGIGNYSREHGVTMLANTNVFKYYTFYALCCHAASLIGILPFDTLAIALFVMYASFLINVWLNNSYDVLADVIAHYLPVVVLLLVNSDRHLDIAFLAWTLVAYVAAHGGVYVVWRYYADIRKHLYDDTDDLSMWQKLCLQKTNYNSAISKVATFMSSIASGASKPA